MAKTFLGLLLAYIGYLSAGGALFRYLEYEDKSEASVNNGSKNWKQVKELILSKHELSEIDDELANLADWLNDICPDFVAEVVQNITHLGNASNTIKVIQEKCRRIQDEEVGRYYPWSFIDALYFSMTVVTTIGYGHLSPSTTAARIACIVYALVGVPLTGIILAYTSGFYGNHLFQLFKTKLAIEKQHSSKFIILAAVSYALLGFAVFIFLPAVVFSFIEEWSYFESVYYAFITLSTIGFGDFVTGRNVEGARLYVYQIGVIVWILIGLSYWVVLADFVTRAFKSKRLHRTLQKRAGEIKRILHQLGSSDKNPKFLPLHSKTTVNLLLQLSSTLMADGDPLPINQNNNAPMSPLRIPGINSLFLPPLPSKSPPLPDLGLNRTSGVQPKVISANSERDEEVSEIFPILSESSCCSTPEPHCFSLPHHCASMPCLSDSCST